MSYIVLAAILVFAYAEEPQQNQQSEIRHITYGQAPPHNPFDLQYDYTLIDPQLQYPPFSGENTRLPPVLVYPGGAPGQQFLLQPGTPPGNFLIPQPHPGVILRDPPPRQPPIYLGGYPKPAHIPPINKDAEEIPTDRGNIPPLQPAGKPEKLETFDIPAKPDVPTKPIAGEADVLAEADRNPIQNPSLKPGHRFFILNGQPLFSNYPLPQFSNSPFQPPPQRFGQANPNYILQLQGGPSFLSDGFPKPQYPTYKVPVPNNYITNPIGYPKPNLNNEIEFPQNYFAFNQKPLESLSVPAQKQNNQPVPVLLKARVEPEKVRYSATIFSLKPIDVPDEEEEEEEPSDSDNIKSDLGYYGYKQVNAKKERQKSVVIVGKVETTTTRNNDTEPSVSQAEPSATALAGPGGVAAAGPRGTALTGDKGLAVSSPQAIALAGPNKDHTEQNPKIKKREH